MPNTKENAAATLIQKIWRGYLIRKQQYMKINAVAKSIINTQFKLHQPSKLFGQAAKPLDVNKTHEFMVTRINPADASLELVTNQGTPDNLRKYLTNANARYGAVINGGFYIFNQFYQLRDFHPLGLNRFKYNFSTQSKRGSIKSDFDNTAHFLNHHEIEQSAEFEEYAGTPIDTKLSLKYQVPYSVHQVYGVVRITSQGKADIESFSHFQSNNDFEQYIQDAKYLMSSGPILVWNHAVVFTEEKLQEPHYQFEQIRKYIGTHPGSIPPGTFYHADQPNPRSAIGFTKQGEILFVTVKGNEEPEHRDGITLPQMALLMKLLGAEKALNLDGGYSAFQGFYRSEMLTPLFIKKAGRESLIPCSIVAREKGEHVHSPKIIKSRRAPRLPLNEVQAQLFPTTSKPASLLPLRPAGRSNTTHDGASSDTPAPAPTLAPAPAAAPASKSDIKKLPVTMTSVRRKLNL